MFTFMLTQAPACHTHTTAHDQRPTTTTDLGYFSLVFNFNFLLPQFHMQVQPQQYIQFQSSPQSWRLICCSLLIKMTITMAGSQFRLKWSNRLQVPMQTPFPNPSSTTSPTQHSAIAVDWGSIDAIHPSRECASNHRLGVFFFARVRF